MGRMSQEAKQSWEIIKCVQAQAQETNCSSQNQARIQTISVFFLMSTVRATTLHYLKPELLPKLERAEAETNISRGCLWPSWLKKKAEFAAD